MTNVRTETGEETGLNLFEGKVSVVGEFPHTVLGYDEQTVDPYIQDLEQRSFEMKAQLRERRRETSLVRAQIGITDLVRLGTHACGLLEATEAQAAKLVHSTEVESDWLRQEARLVAATAREAVQQEAGDVRLSELASLCKLHQKQTEVGQAVLETARYDANLVHADAEAQSRSLLEKVSQRINAQPEATRIDVAQTCQGAEWDTTVARLATEKSTVTAPSGQAETTRRTEEDVNTQSVEVRSCSETITEQIEEVRVEAIEIQESTVEETEQTRITTIREARAILPVMREGVHQKQKQLEEQVAWRKEQPEREVTASMAHRTSIVASAQNLHAMAEEAVPNMELTRVINGGEVTALQPQKRKQAK